MSLADWAMTAGILLAVLGAGSVVADAVHAGGDRRFVGYLVALLLTLAGVGLALSVAL